MSSDCSILKAGESDFAEISISVVDENGTLVPEASNRIAAKVNGCGSLLGVISADMTSNESYRSDSCNALKGRCMAVVKTAKEAGSITVVVEGDGLIPAQIVLVSE